LEADLADLWKEVMSSPQQSSGSPVPAPSNTPLFMHNDYFEAEIARGMNGGSVDIGVGDEMTQLMSLHTMDSPPRSGSQNVLPIRGSSKGMGTATMTNKT